MNYAANPPGSAILHCTNLLFGSVWFLDLFLWFPCRSLHQEMGFALSDCFSCKTHTRYAWVTLRCSFPLCGLDINTAHIFLFSAPPGSLFSLLLFRLSHPPAINKQQRPTEISSDSAVILWYASHDILQLLRSNDNQIWLFLLFFRKRQSAEATAVKRRGESLIVPQHIIDHPSCQFYLKQCLICVQLLLSKQPAYVYKLTARFTGWRGNHLSFRSYRGG